MRLSRLVSFHSPILMGWTPPNGITMCQDSGVETRYNKEASMDKVSIVGIDIAKNAFRAHGAGADGSVVFR